MNMRNAGTTKGKTMTAKTITAGQTFTTIDAYYPATYTAVADVIADKFSISNGLKVRAIMAGEAEECWVLFGANDKVAA